MKWSDFFLLLAFNLLVMQLIILSSCKEEGHSVPGIQVDSPYENATYAVPDTIRVAGRVLFDDPLTSLKVTVVDQNYAPVSPVYPISLIQLHDHDNILYFQQDIIIDAISLESGMYFIWIYASTTHTEKNKYLPISLIGVEKKFQHLFLFVKTNVSTTSMFSVDSLWQVSKLYDFPSDVGHVCADHVARRLYLAGEKTPKLFAYHPDCNRLEWEKAGQGTQDLPYYQGLVVDGGMVFASAASGRLAGYKPDGSTGFMKDFGFEAYPVQACMEDNILVIAVRQRNGLNYINNYFYPSGSYITGLQVSFIARAMYSIDNNLLLIAGNQSGIGALRYWIPSLPGLTAPCSFPQETITGMIRLHKDHYLVSTHTGIYWFQPATSTLTTFVAGIPITGIDADITTNRVFVTTHDQLRVYSFPQGNLLRTEAVGDSVRACLVLYNK